MYHLNVSNTLDLDEERISILITNFYARVRADEMLGSVFENAIHESDWAVHLERMTDFWLSVMLSANRYHGKPVQAHAQHLGTMHPDMFTRWLEIWTQAVQEEFSPESAQLLVKKAIQIAKSLKFALFGMNS